MEHDVLQQPDNNKSPHALSDHNVFADPKLQHDPNRPLRIRILATTEERGGEQYVAALIPVSELRRAKRGTTAQHRGIGFALEVEFALPTQDGRFVLTSSWVTINAR